MDQYSYNEHRLEYCVCGADFEPKPCTCGYYERPTYNKTKEVSQYGKSNEYLRKATCDSTKS